MSSTSSVSLQLRTGQSLKSIASRLQIPLLVEEDPGAVIMSTPEDPAEGRRMFWAAVAERIYGTPVALSALACSIRLPRRPMMIINHPVFDKESCLPHHKERMPLLVSEEECARLRREGFPTGRIGVPFRGKYRVTIAPEEVSSMTFTEFHAGFLEVGE